MVRPNHTDVSERRWACNELFKDGSAKLQLPAEQDNIQDLQPCSKNPNAGRKPVWQKVQENHPVLFFEIEPVQVAINDGAVQRHAFP